MAAYRFFPNSSSEFRGGFQAGALWAIENSGVLDKLQGD